MKKVYAGFKGKPRWLFRYAAALAVIIFASSGSMAQGSTHVNIELRNASLPEVFEQIRRQTSMSVIYSNDDLTDVAKKDYLIRNASIDQAIQQVIAHTGLEYELSNNVIVIRQASVIQAQPVVIRGQVRDSDNNALVGATIAIPGTNQGTVTDANGNFEFRATVSGTPMLRISYVGYKTQDVTFTGASLTITLEHAETMVAEVVVTGVFDRVADSYTGAVTTIKKEQLERVGNQNLLQTLKNVDPSFQVIESNEYGSDPNRLPDIQMRGATNFSDMRDKYQTSPNQPLFVLDGFETTLQKVMDLDMNRVSTITLLKDATAKALYGSKGANGVVVIETVAPETGQLKVSYTGDLSVIAPDLSSYNLANAAEKLEIERRAGVYTSVNPISQQYLTEQYNALHNEVLRGVNTYWLSKPLRTAVGNNHSLYLEGGDDTFRYGFDFGYNNVQGVMKGSGRETISGSVNFQYRYRDFRFRDQLSVDFNTADNSPYGSFSEYSRLNHYWRANNEDGSIRDILGTYAVANSQGSHPIYNPAINASLATKDRTSYMSVTNNFYVEWDAFEGMRFEGRFGLVSKRNDSDYFLPRDHTSFRDIPVDSEEFFNRGRYTMGTGKSFDYNADISANYSKEWSGKHVLFANMKWGLSENKSENVSVSAEGFGNNKVDYITYAKQYPSSGSPTGSEALSREASFLASVNYSFDERFLLDASFRANGSSLFGADKRWGAFWSTGIGWNLHKESWLKDTGWLERLRLRASTGFSGSQNFQTYQALATYKYYTVTYDNIIGANQLGLANPNLKWQRTQDHNIGLDLSILNTLEVTFDYYLRNTRDMLTPVTMPPSSGFDSYVENLGQVRNTGFETRVNYRVIRDTEREIYLSVFASAVHNKNKLVKISDALTAFNEERDTSKGPQNANTESNHETNKHVTKPSVRYIEGVSMDAIWAVRSLGIDPWTGREVFVKADGSLTTTWDPADYTVAGVSLPKYSGTFGFNFDYKGFSVNTSFYFRIGGQYYNQTLVDKVENADIQYNVDRRMYTDRWSSDTAGKPAKFKAFNTQSGFTRPTTRFVQDLNELQMTSLNIGYDFRYAGFIEKGSFMERLKVQFYCNDLFRASTVRVERGTEYPFARTFSLKIQATF